MKKYYLIRLDDACPTMNRSKWDRIEALLDKYDILPMVGVIPHNEDPAQQFGDVDSTFWEKVASWKDKGWAIALHGYNHCYTTESGIKGLNPMWSRSEFAGLSLNEQKLKIQRGVSIMRDNHINPKYFFAPSHTFDENTLTALREESDIRIISDTIATKPYQYKDFAVIPQIGGHCMHIPFPGIWTFCLHPNTMTEESFIRVEGFINRNYKKFTSFSKLDLTNLKKKNIFNRFFSSVYFIYRRIRGIK